MAEVLGPIASTSTMTIHHPQDAFQNTTQAGLTTTRRQLPRHSLYNPQLPSMGYRGPSSLPISPYAFQTTPQMRQDKRLSAAPVLRQPPNQLFRHPYQDSSASSTSSASSSSNRSGGPYHISKDDSVLSTRQRQSFPDSRFSRNIIASASTPDLSLPSNFEVKPSPDRYKRSSRVMENVPPVNGSQTPDQSPQLRPVSAPLASNSDHRSLSDSLATKRLSLGLRSDTFDDYGAPTNATRYKRRSGIGRTDSSPAVQSIATPINASAPTWSQVVAGKHNIQGPLPPPQYVRPQHLRSSSYEDSRSAPAVKPVSSRHSTYGPSRSTVNADTRPKTAPSIPDRSKAALTSQPIPVAVPDRPKTANPVSKPSGLSNEISSTSSPRPQTSGASQSNSPAVQQLSALSEKNQKGVKSRLRRAFSFSSSHELRKATAENNMVAERAKLRKEKFDNEQQVEDASVAAKQEAGGLGENIYTHQGPFTASTDNISISSTASSASIMLRKMGKGMKKSTRNLRNLFRPKSMIAGSSTDLTTAENSAASAQVSLVTVEAERERVNVNADPHDLAGGGTGYPRLERNSIDFADRPDSPQSTPGDIRSRKSIIGGDRERAEVLAVVRKKGILKRGTSTSSSPTIGQDDDSLTTVTGGNSAPATPADGAQGNIEFFAGINPDAQLSTRSLPSRNISFNNKVVFHDVWSPTEYDRRGDVATCNRLTPMLAQQIKEELNSFKMEMEVHEDSKPHTHFF